MEPLLVVSALVRLASVRPNAVAVTPPAQSTVLAATRSCLPPFSFSYETPSASIADHLHLRIAAARRGAPAIAPPCGERSSG